MFFYHSRTANCAWRASDGWADPSARTVTLLQLTNGITIRERLTHSVFPSNPQPFTYENYLLAEIVDSPDAR